MTKTFYIERTKKGFPAIWESGGAYTNTGNSIIISDKNGNEKKPLYVRNYGNRACGNHALIKVDVGDYIYEVCRHRESYKYHIYRVIHIYDTYISSIEVEFHPKNGKALMCAIDKAFDYHCREAFFVKKEEIFPEGKVYESFRMDYDFNDEDDDDEF